MSISLHTKAELLQITARLLRK